MRASTRASGPPWVLPPRRCTACTPVVQQYRLPPAADGCVLHARQRRQPGPIVLGDHGVRMPGHALQPWLRRGGRGVSQPAWVEDNPSLVCCGAAGAPPVHARLLPYPPPAGLCTACPSAATCPLRPASCDPRVRRCCAFMGDGPSSLSGDWAGRSPGTPKPQTQADQPAVLYRLLRRSRQRDVPHGLQDHAGQCVAGGGHPLLGAPRRLERSMPAMPQGWGLGGPGAPRRTSELTVR